MYYSLFNFFIIISDRGDSNVRSKAEVQLSLCLKDGHQGFVELPPQDGCIDTNDAVENIFIGKQMIEFVNMSGAACSCLTPGCNEPAGNQGEIIPEKSPHCK